MSPEDLSARVVVLERRVRVSCLLVAVSALVSLSSLAFALWGSNEGVKQQLPGEVHGILRARRVEVVGPNGLVEITANRGVVLSKRIRTDELQYEAECRFDDYGVQVTRSSREGDLEREVSSRMSADTVSIAGVVSLLAVSGAGDSGEKSYGLLTLSRGVGDKRQPSVMLGSKIGGSLSLLGGDQAGGVSIRIVSDENYADFPEGLLRDGDGVLELRDARGERKVLAPR